LRQCGRNSRTDQEQTTPGNHAEFHGSDPFAANYRRWSSGCQIYGTPPAHEKARGFYPVGHNGHQESSKPDRLQEGDRSMFSANSFAENIIIGRKMDQSPAAP
jgi:hypothetical protein